MPSNRKKRNTASRDQKKLLIAASLTCNVVLLLALAFVAPKVIRSQSSKPANDTETSVHAQNDESFKEAFMANCVLQAEVNLGKTMANKYCGCALDRGIEVYGEEGFIEVNQQITKTYDMHELKPIIDECAAKATGDKRASLSDDN
jgi:hypothetical protein